MHIMLFVLHHKDDLFGKLFWHNELIKKFLFFDIMIFCPLFLEKKLFFESYFTYPSIQSATGYFPKSHMGQATLVLCDKVIKLISKRLIKVLDSSKTRYS